MDGGEKRDLLLTQDHGGVCELNRIDGIDARHVNIEGGGKGGGRRGEGGGGK